MRAAWLAAGLAAGLVLGGCASPQTQFYTLNAMPGAAVSGGPRTVMLRRPGLAGYLDRPEIVRSGGSYQLKLAGNEQWGEPLGGLLGRVLTEDISRRLPGSSVYIDTGAISADPAATLEIDFQRFDADPGGPVTLLVQWSIEQGRGNPSGPPVTERITVTPITASTADLAAAMSTALGQAADHIATALRTLGTPTAGGQSQGRRARR